MRQTAFEAQISALIEPTLEGLGYELVRVRLMGPEKHRTLQVMAERGDGTMDVDGCAEVSRVISAVLDVEDPIAGTYDLEVSSPGLDRPLTRLKDFAANAGRQAKIELHTPLDGRRRYKGALMGVDGQTVKIRAQNSDGGEADFALPFGQISEAQIVLTDKEIRTLMAERDAAAE